MKTISKLLIGAALVSSMLTACMGRYYYVSSRPAEPVYSRPVAPYAGAIWVPGEWAWRGGRYQYINGYWARPKGTRVYVQGEWVQGQRGYYWRRGHWN